MVPGVAAFAAFEGAAAAPAIGVEVFDVVWLALVDTADVVVVVVASVAKSRVATVVIEADADNQPSYHNQRTD